MSHVGIFLGSLLFGNVAVLPFMWLGFAHRVGSWSVFSVLATILIAHIVGDVLWYTLGRRSVGIRWGGWVHQRLPRSAYFDEQFERHHGTLIIISKLLATPTIPLLFVAGWNKMQHRRYARIMLISTLIWFPIATGIAYATYKGVSAIGAVPLRQSVELLVVAGVATALLVQYVVVPALRRLIKQYQHLPKV